MSDDGDYGRTAYAGDPRDQEDWDLRHNVTEIMGWKRAEGYDDRWEHPVSHVAHLAGDGYTCDDMVEWINDHSPWGFAGIIPNDDDWTVLLYLKADDTEFDEHAASTLHAALEQAVIAVGCAE